MAQTVTRGPYLQQGSNSQIIVRWRTDIAGNSRVRYGTTLVTPLPTLVDNATSTTEHVVKITGLAANTKYFYSVGSTTATLSGPDANTFFVTAPTPGVAKNTRIWVLGDSGTNNSSQKAVRDAYYSFTGTRHTDLWLMLGDNAYSDGTDANYQSAVFDATNAYPAMLRKSVLWPTIGNHDGHSADSLTQTGPYYDIFSLPTNAEAGGMASGTEAYYSFDYGNIHFICLESYQVPENATAFSTMKTWVTNDVNSTAREWIVAFWHHPPYTKGSHDSDTESQLIKMRTDVNPILENGGVDLVLCGHSHAYERSFLIDGHYGHVVDLTAAMKLDSGSGRDPNPYQKSAGTPSHDGTVYVVAGSSGQTGGGSLNHPAMFISPQQSGLDGPGHQRQPARRRLPPRDRAVDDTFAIVKGSAAPAAAAVTVTATDASASEAGPNSGTFTIARTGSTATSLTVSFSIGGSATNGTDYATLTSPGHHRGGLGDEDRDGHADRRQRRRVPRDGDPDADGRLRLHRGLAASATVTIADNDNPTRTRTATDCRTRGRSRTSGTRRRRTGRAIPTTTGHERRGVRGGDGSDGSGLPAGIAAPSRAAGEGAAAAVLHGPGGAPRSAFLRAPNPIKTPCHLWDWVLYRSMLRGVLVACPARRCGRDGGGSPPPRLDRKTPSAEPGGAALRVPGGIPHPPGGVEGPASPRPLRPGGRNTQATVCFETVDAVEGKVACEGKTAVGAKAHPAENRASGPEARHAVLLHDPAGQRHGELQDLAGRGRRSLLRRVG
jgi:hypothetical protein